MPAHEGEEAGLFCTLGTCLRTCFVTASGYDYYDVFGAKWDETYPDELLPEVHENPYKNQPRREALNELTGPFESEEEYSHVGGYPSFVQNDPRDEFEELRGHTVNLLTIESEWGEDAEEGVYVMWGDAGAANWLITPEGLPSVISRRSSLSGPAAKN